MKKGHEHPELVKLVVKLVAENFGITPEDIAGGKREHSQARAMTAFLLKQEHGLCLQSVRGAIGVNSDAPVYAYAKAGANGATSPAGDPVFKQRLEKVRAGVLSGIVSKNLVEPVESDPSTEGTKTGGKRKYTRRAGKGAAARKAGKRKYTRTVKLVIPRKDVRPGEDELRRIAAALCSPDILLSLDPGRTADTAKAVLIYVLWENTESSDVMSELELKLGLSQEEMYAAIGKVSVLLRQRDNNVLEMYKNASAA